MPSTGTAVPCSSTMMLLVGIDGHPVARLVLGVPVMPQTWVTRTWWMPSSASIFCQRSTFETGLRRAAFLALPALALPVGQPLADPLGDVLAVGDQLDLARALERSRAPR